MGSKPPRKKTRAAAPPPAARPAANGTGARRARSSVVVWAAAGVLVVAAAAGAWWWQRGAAFTLPPATPAQNVVLVTIDTLRADALSVYGGPAETPNLDALAAHGARFTFAHAHAVVTLPSHTTILTGRFPYEHGMRDNSGFRVKAGTVTLATRLKALGFETGAFVGGFPLTKRFGLAPGFDEYDDQMPEMHGAVSFALPERPADVVVSRALDWIGTRHDKFFAWVHVYDPHSPYRPPLDYASKYQGRPYYGEVAFTDHALGPLFDRLATLSRPTLVIVTADHGESLGEHNELTHGMFAYESTLHVPLIVAEIDPHAQARARASVIDTPVRHIDIVPTVLDAIGAPADASLPGASLREVIRDRRGPDRPGYFEAMTYNLVRGWPPLRGVLVARSKYIDLPIPELYDLAADPREADNLAARQADRTQILVNTLRGYNMAPPGRAGAVTAAEAEALRALGYSSGSAGPRDSYTESDDPKNLARLDLAVHDATNLYQSGKIQEAITELERVVAERPDTSDAVIQLAYAYYESGQIRPAIATLEGALKKGSTDRDIRIRLGLYLSETGVDSARAIKLLESLPSDDVEALNGLGVAYGDSGRQADAIRTFKRVLELDPTNGLAFQNLASSTLRIAHATGNADKVREAEALARQAIDADPSLASAYTTYGVILSDLGRKPEAIDSFRHAVDLDNTEFNALYNLWSLLKDSGRRDEAVRYGRLYVQTAPPALNRDAINEIRAYLGG